MLYVTNPSIVLPGCVSARPILYWQSRGRRSPGSRPLESAFAFGLFVPSRATGPPLPPVGAGLAAAPFPLGSKLCFRSFSVPFRRFSPFLVLVLYRVVLILEGISTTFKNPVLLRLHWCQSAAILAPGWCELFFLSVLPRLSRSSVQEIPVNVRFRGLRLFGCFLYSGRSRINRFRRWRHGA